MKEEKSICVRRLEIERTRRKKGRTTRRRIQASIEHILELLKDLGDISDEVRKKIYDEKDLEVLSKWFKLAAKSDTMEQFIKAM